MEGAAKYPLQILPKELWEMIILEVKDSGDIRSLMKASKQLNRTFTYIHHLWLLDKVIPILMPITKPARYRYLDLEDLKMLRLVNKRWSREVNAFLENQPDLRPYNKEDNKVNSEAHIWSECCLKFNFDECLYWYPMGGVTFYDFEKIDDFNNEFRNAENPFFSGSVVGRTKSGEYLNDDDNLVRHFPGPVGQGKQAFWEEMVHTLFKKFGKHISYLTMMWLEEDTDSDWDCEFRVQSLVWKSIVKSLSSLANLKGLNLNFEAIEVCSFGTNKFIQSEENQLPSLPLLESLNIISRDFKSDHFSPQLVSKYCLQLRRLQLPISRWDARRNWTFPNLTELSLLKVFRSEDVTKLITSLEAPHLAKLELAGRDPCDYDKYIEEDHNKLNVEEVFSWITLIPSLLHLDISCSHFIITESGALKPLQDSKPSLKYLKIYNSSGVNYNFLRCLPNLERLQVHVDKEPVVWDCSAYPKIKIKLELETCSIYQSNVWELCPKLKTVSLRYEGVNNEAYHEFDRTTFEKLKDNPELLLNRAAALKLRKEILEFIK